MNYWDRDLKDLKVDPPKCEAILLFITMLVIMVVW